MKFDRGFISPFFINNQKGRMNGNFVLCNFIFFIYRLSLISLIVAMYIFRVMVDLDTLSPFFVHMSNSPPPLFFLFVKLLFLARKVEYQDSLVLFSEKKISNVSSIVPALEISVKMGK